MSQDQFAENLKIIVAEKLQTVPNFNEDVTYVAEYIVLLIVNGGSVESVVQELSTLFDAVSPDSLTDIVQTAFFALEALQQGEAVEGIVAKIRGLASQNQATDPANNIQISNEPVQQQTMQQPVVEQQQEPGKNQAGLQSMWNDGSSWGTEPAKEQPAAQSGSGWNESSSWGTESATTDLNGKVSAFSGLVEATPINTDDQQSFETTGFKPQFSTRGDFNSRRGGRGGRGGRGNRGGRANRHNDRSNHARFNPLAKALGMTSDSTLNFVNQRKEGRCKLFPHCPLGKSCPHAHPTKVCHEYPNCPKAPGTCEYLHPDQDEDLMREIEATREEFQKRKAAMIAARQKPVQTGLVICKFGILCSNPMCPFGHPTPANDDAKVIDLAWCPNNLTCQDTQCKKAHSSLSKIRDVAPMGGRAKPSPVSRPPIEKSLEQCKYGTHCTNKRCKYRHARSHVMCREGANCMRIDCLFGHPINEDCRFGIECRNQYCLFRHPEGRTAPPPQVMPVFDASAPVTQFPLNTSMNNDTNNNNIVNSPFTTSERAFAVPNSAVQSAPAQEGLKSMYAPNPEQQDTDMN